MSTYTEIDSQGDTKQTLSANANTGYAFTQVLCSHSCFFNFSYFQTGEPCLIPESEISQWANAFWLTSQAHHITLLTSLGSALGNWGFTNLGETISQLFHSSQIILVQEHCLLLLVFLLFIKAPLTPVSSTALVRILCIKHQLLDEFPLPYAPEAPRWGEATLLWH